MGFHAPALHPIVVGVPVAFLKRGRLGRALSLSRMGAKLALGQGKRLLAGDPMQVHRELAMTMVREMGQLKGLPMKVGQILSYMEGVVPDEYRTIYQDILGQLRTQSEPMAWEAAAEVFEQELGAPPEQLLDSIDHDPIASASIGQVHRAIYRGQQVCVKIQYPGIAEATISDMKNLGGIIDLMHAVMPNVDVRQAIDDIQTRLEEECDYRQEAEYQHRFAGIYRDDPDILVPDIIDALCAQRVLTTEYVEGTTFDEFRASASTEERNRAGMTLFRFAFGTLLQHGLFHADPHPGNLLFSCGDRRRLCVLDYGCVQPLPIDARRDIASLLRAAMEGRDLRHAAQRALGVSELDPATAEVMTRITGEALAPIVAPQPFRFTREFATRVSRHMIEAKMDLNLRFLSRRGRLVVDRGGVMFVVRNLFGLASIWGTLETEGDYRALVEQMLAGAELG